MNTLILWKGYKDSAIITGFQSGAVRLTESTDCLTALTICLLCSARGLQYCDNSLFGILERIYMLARIYSGAMVGIDAVLCEVEVDVGKGGFERSTIVGLPDVAVKESIERV